MTIFFNADPIAFYDDTISPNVPATAKEITYDLHQALLAGQSEGKTITADINGDPVLLDPVGPTAAQIQKALADAVQQSMDDKARDYGYDNLNSVVTYAEEPSVPKFQAEGQAFRAWRSLVWKECYVIMDEVNAGARDIPTEAELLAELAVSAPFTAPVYAV